VILDAAVLTPPERTTEARSAGYVETTVAETNKARMFGLSNGDTDTLKYISVRHFHPIVEVQSLGLRREAQLQKNLRRNPKRL
jgi:hypothetical protein